MRSVTNLFRCKLSYFLDTGRLITVLTEKQKLIKYLKGSKCLGYKEKILTIFVTFPEKDTISRTCITHNKCAEYTFFMQK